MTLILFCVVFVTVITAFLENSMVVRSKLLTAEFITEEVRNEFVAADFITPKTGSDYNDLSEKLEHLSLGPNVERIKIWNKDKAIVWSDSEKIVGQRFPDNENLGEALGGEIVSEISLLGNAENIFENAWALDSYDLS